MSSGSRKGVEVTLLFTAFIASTYGFGMYLFPAMVEAVRLDIPFSYATMGTISGFVQAGFMICALLVGFLTLQFGAMPMILGSVSLCAIGLLGLAVAPNIIVMAVCLTILGGCAAAIWVPMVEVARDHISIGDQLWGICQQLPPDHPFAAVWMAISLGRNGRSGGSAGFARNHASSGCEGEDSQGYRN
jgi:MFS family permease